MFKLHERYARIFGIPALGIFLAFLFCPETLPSGGYFLKSITVAFIFWQGNFSILTFFRNKFTKVKQTTKRIVYTVFVILVYTIVSDILMRMVFDYFFPELVYDIESLPVHFTKNFFISMLVTMVYELTYFYTRWNSATLETEKLKTQQIISQLESLKNQISPHFLFNSLNTLVAIIPEDQEQAVKFTERLSDVYRYILQYKDKELVVLSMELDFIESYLFLLKIRYPENLKVNYNIKKEALKTHIAPLTLQILVENVIKHNVISKSEPLTIDIYTDNKNRVIVRNYLNLKSIAKNSTKMGLENIHKRYQYLTDKTVEVVNDSSEFLVAVPLIIMNLENN